MWKTLRRRLEAANRGDTNEVEQAKVRFAIFGAITAYGLGWYLSDGMLDAHELKVVELGFVILSLTLAHFCWVLAVPGPHVPRRHLVVLLDLGTVSAFMWSAGEMYVPLFGLYLWIVVANGFRYGAYYLRYAQGVALLSFGLVWAFTDSWRAHPGFSGGLMLVLVVMPLYVSVLISRLHAAGRRLDAARSEAEAANLSKTKFLAAASHDLRQPMQALSMYASVLEQTVAEPGARRVLNGVALSVRTLEQLFDSLLDVSKIETGVLQPSPASFRLMPLIERVVEAERPIAEHKGLSLRVARTAASVRSDPLLLERMLKNLLTNAIRYTARGAILIGCRRAGADRLRLVVVDTGVGIAAPEQGRIFDEYYQIDGKSAQGLGLGLTIVKSLGDLLRHAVSVKSTPGRGSAFSIELERVAETLPPRAEPARYADLNGICVVLLDDDAEIRAGMGLLFETWGCRCIAGATLGAVQQWLRDAGVVPDAMIVDYRLSEPVTGLEAIARLRGEFGNAIPALLITGTHDVAALPWQAGVPVLSKPAAPGKLRAFLSRAARRSTDAG